MYIVGQPGGGVVHGICLLKLSSFFPINALNACRAGELPPGAADEWMQWMN